MQIHLLNVLFGLLIIVAVLKLYTLLFDLLNMINGYPPNLSSAPSSIKTIIAEVPASAKSIVDLGCGNGKIIDSLKKHPGNILGFELNPLLAFYCKLKFGRYKNIKIINANILDQNLSMFDTIIIYGIKELVEKLEEKIIADTSVRAKIISNKFPFKKLQLSKQIGDVYIYDSLV